MGHGEDLGLVRLFSTSHQSPASQQYFSLTINQPQPPATSQPNETLVSMAVDKQIKTNL
jgi:hypothetical protein